ncbi:D-alanyl-D-alanine carboxypeptidase [Eubacterium ruminantium]|nr:D-alanyl-D-alanine carboxypeptidase [Eubacterium ruminantium]
MKNNTFKYKLISYLLITIIIAVSFAAKRSYAAEMNSLSKAGCKNHNSANINFNTNSNTNNTIYTDTHVDTDRISYFDAKDKATATNTDAPRVKPPEIKSKSGIVMDIDTGFIMYEKAAYQKHYPASITKIMTALIALQNGDLNSTIVMSDAAIDNTPVDSSNIALSYGEKISLKNALYAMLLSSANEAAYGIAEHVGGSLSAFCDMMNKKAADLGCKSTHFANASGLHDKDHYTCCYDMALIGIAAYALPEFKDISSTLTYTIPATNLNTERVLWHGDNMLFGSNEYYYPYAVCGKTGYTDEANGTLVTFAEKDGQRLVCVVMDVVPSSETFKDSAALLDYCFENFHTFKPLEHFSFNKLENDSPVLANYYNSLSHTLPNLSTDTDIVLHTVNYINADNIEKNIILYNVSDSKVVGKIELSFEGEKLGEVDIINNDYIPPVPKNANDDTEEKKKDNNGFHWYYILIILIAIVLMIIAIELKTILQRQRRKKVRSYPVQKKPSKKKKKKYATTAKKVKTGISLDQAAAAQNSADISKTSNLTSKLSSAGSVNKTKSTDKRRSEESTNIIKSTNKLSSAESMNKIKSTNKLSSAESMNKKSSTNKHRSVVSDGKSKDIYRNGLTKSKNKTVSNETGSIDTTTKSERK